MPNAPYGKSSLFTGTTFSHDVLSSPISIFRSSTNTRHFLSRRAPFSYGEDPANATGIQGEKSDIECIWKFFSGRAPSTKSFVAHASWGYKSSAHESNDGLLRNLTRICEFTNENSGKGCDHGFGWLETGRWRRKMGTSSIQNCCQINVSDKEICDTRTDNIHCKSTQCMMQRAMPVDEEYLMRPYL